jgi:autotransporter-associated beta strand protein
MLRVGKCKLQALVAAATLAAPVIGLAQVSGTWQAANSGTWNDNANWNGVTYPSGGGAAVFVNPSANLSVTLPSAFGTTLSNIDFQQNGVNGFTLTGAGSIMLGTLAGANGTINVATGGTGTISSQLATQANGNLFKTGNGTLVLSGTNAFGTATGLQVSGGVLQANSSASVSGLAAVTTAGTGQIVLNNANIGGFGGLGSNPTGGAVRSLAGNNTWAGSWFLVANTSVGVDAGSLTLTGVVFDSAQTAANGLTKVGAGTFSTAQLALNGPLTVNEGRVRLADNGAASATSQVGGLNIAGGAVPTAALDVRNNDLIINYAGSSPLTTVKAQIKAAYNGGAWNGNGLTTSLGGTIVGGPFAGKTAALGYAEATQLGSPTSFNGYSIDGTTMLVKYTLAGDADLDGDIDPIDVGKWALNFTGDLGGAGTKTWAEGDWDYDGDVDPIDVGKWALNFTGDLGGAGLGPIVVGDSVNPIAVSTLSAMGFAVTVVPEPATMGMLAAAGLGLLARRRRTH